MSNSTDTGRVETYRFHRDHLKPGSRLPGISAFMRVKNGAEFIEATIRSHMPYLDEIVVVHNQCTDATPEILSRLAAEFGPKLRVFHYLPKVHAPGSAGHASEPADSPASFVNQSNFALAQTRFQVAMKLDDDDLAMAEPMAALTQRIRDANFHLGEVLCFSGINLARDERGELGVLAREPFAGTGDHFFFAVTPGTFFVHDRRFEDFAHGGRRIFGDITYWHLKYLKSGFGFANRDIEGGANPRFAKKRERFLADRRIVPIHELAVLVPTWVSFAPILPLPDKQRLIANRWRVLRDNPPTQHALDRWREPIGLS